MNNKWRSLVFLTPAVCVTVFAVFGLFCNQPIFPVLSGKHFHSPRKNNP